MNDIVYAFDKDENRISTLNKALGDDYTLINIQNTENLDDIDIHHAVGIVLDPEMPLEILEAIYNLVASRPIPVFIWVPLGEQGPLQDFRRSLKLIPSPPTIEDIENKMIPYLGSEINKHIVLATTDDRLVGTLSPALEKKNWTITRVTDSSTLKQVIDESEVSLVFSDISLASGLAEFSPNTPRYPLIINSPKPGEFRAPLILDQLTTILPDELGVEAISEIISNANNRGLKAQLKETEMVLAPIYAQQNFRTAERLLEILVDYSKQDFLEKRSQEMNVMNTHTMGLITELLEVFENLVGNFEILSKTTKSKKLPSEIFDIRGKIDHAQDILETLNSLMVYEESGPIVPLDLKKIITKAVSKVKANRRRKNIEWEIDLNQLGSTVGREKELEECFENILINSYEAIPKKGKIKILTKDDPEWNSIIISDYGSGMKENILENVSRPFFSTKSASHKGLGFTISKGIVESHNGEIEIQSEKNKGTTVYIRLPRSVQQKVEEQGSQPDVLVVAHHRSLGFLQSLLVRRGWSVITADSVGGSVQKIKQFKPRIVLIQAKMGHMDPDGIRMIINKKGDAKTILLDPSEQISPGIKGLDTSIRGSFALHQLIAIINAYIEEQLKKA